MTRNLLGVLLSVVLILAFALLAMGLGSIGSDGPRDPHPRMSNQTHTGPLPTASGSSTATAPEE